MDPTNPTPYAPAEDPEGAAAYAALLESATRSPDPAAHLRVMTWILSEMADTFTLLAFANACDECAEAGTPHPYAPGPGGNYDDCMKEAEMPPGLYDQAARAAVRLYAAVLAAPGGYDPAPALLRGDAEPGKVVSNWWHRRYGTHREAAARCWGHYAVMEALGHGVAWEDDNEPLGYEVDGTRYDLPAVGDLGVSVDDLTWDDEYTDAARAVLDARDYRAEVAARLADVDAGREQEARDEEAAERAEWKREHE
jgi:hypothetical protein